MNVKRLKELINDLPDDMEVIVQKDVEGNEYSPLSDVDSNAIYLVHTSWYGDAYSTNWSADDACMSEDEWEAFKEKHPKVLILSPVN